MSDPLIASAEAEIRRFKELSARRDVLDKNVSNLKAAHNERKRVLKGYYDECRDAGLNPNTLREDVQHMVEVVKVKNDTFAAELDAAEAMVKPMLAEVKG